MTINKENQAEIKISKIKLVCGFLIFLISFFAPLFIPVIVQLKISAAIKTLICGLLLFGIPEIGMLIAVIILGNEGYAYLKTHLLFWLKSTVAGAPSRTRYKIGIVLFSLSLVLGFIMPYISYFFPTIIKKNLYFYILTLDLLFLLSLFILGKNFWGKLKALFIYD